MNKRYGSPEGRPNLIRALLVGEMPILGNVDGTIGGLLLPRESFRRFVQTEATRVIHGWGSCCQAAVSLSCERRIVRGLLKLGLLRGQRVGTRFDIMESSIVGFKKMYVSVGSFARELNTNSKGIVRYCRRKGIPLITVGQGNRTQAFMHTKDKEFITARYKIGSAGGSRSHPRHLKGAESEQVLKK
jgi:hypothetical protein